jgi:hypothetical protein
MAASAAAGGDDRCSGHDLGSAPWTGVRPRSGRAAAERPSSCRTPHRKVLQAALAHIAAAEHDGEQAGSLGRQEWLPVGGVMDCDGSLELSSARQWRGLLGGGSWPAPGGPSALPGSGVRQPFDSTAATRGGGSVTDAIEPVEAHFTHYPSGPPREFQRVIPAAGRFAKAPRSDT